MKKDAETIGKYISILYRSGTMYFNKNFNDYKIGSGQYMFLLFLSNNEGVTQEEISCKLYIDKGTTAKALKKLEEQGYVKRAVDENDKRAYKVYLTDEGKNSIDSIYKILVNWNNILTYDFSEEEKEVALKLLKRMINNKNR